MVFIKSSAQRAIPFLQTVQLEHSWGRPTSSKSVPPAGEQGSWSRVIGFLASGSIYWIMSFFLEGISPLFWKWFWWLFLTFFFFNYCFHFGYFKIQEVSRSLILREKSLLCTYHKILFVALLSFGFEWKWIFWAFSFNIEETYLTNLHTDRDLSTDRSFFSSYSLSTCHNVCSWFLRLEARWQSCCF